MSSIERNKFEIERDREAKKIYVSHGFDQAEFDYSNVLVIRRLRRSEDDEGPATYLKYAVDCTDLELVGAALDMEIDA